MVWRGYLRSLLPQTTVCVSDAVSVALHKDYRFADRNLVTVRNGVDIDRFRENPDARALIRTEWGVPETAVLFGAVCRLVPEKGLDVCLEAFRRMTTVAATPSYLVVVGEGPQRPALEALSLALGLADRVRFAGFRSDVPGVLSALDFLVLPSRLEGLPLIVLESLAVGRPVIATRVAGTPEILTRDDVGWLVAPGDVGELTHALQDAALQSPERVEAMRTAARQHAVGQFNASQQYAKIALILEA
jgi:glycosyltransferase involved in cell wall biosynthesis